MFDIGPKTSCLDAVVFELAMLLLHFWKGNSRMCDADLQVPPQIGIFILSPYLSVLAKL